mgnify:CR=1 FL=1
MTNLTMTPAITTDAAAALKDAAWKIAARVAARKDASNSADLILSAMLSGSDDNADIAKINALMDAAAELDGVTARGTWADSMISDCANDIAEAERKMIAAKAAMDAATETDEMITTTIAHQTAYRSYIKLTSI